MALQLTLRTEAAISTEPKPRDRTCQKGGNISEYDPLFDNSIAGTFASVQMPASVRKVSI
jgi:hypothetical protein